MPFTYPSLQDRIIANSVVSDSGIYGGEPCWDWTGAFNSQGYGKMGIRFKRGPRKGKVKAALAHREAVKAFKRRIVSTGTVIRHLCGRRCCVNPSHLRGGTQRQNVRDAIRHGTHKTPWRRVNGERYAGSTAR